MQISDLQCGNNFSIRFHATASSGSCQLTLLPCELRKYMFYFEKFGLIKTFDPTKNYVSILQHMTFLLLPILISTQTRLAVEPKFVK